MPITSSAKKALRKSVTNRSRNLKRKSSLGETIRNYKKLITDKKIEEASKLLPMVYKAIDKNAKVGFLKSNTASRLKSRLSKKINSKV
jgi:small subunit ribosomal protein S20